MIDVAGVDTLVHLLADRGYRVVGPTLRDGAITYAEITGVADLPVGWGDDQEAGTYRLRRRDDDALFAYAVGPDSARRYLTPPTRTLWSATRDGDGFTIHDEPPEDPPLALFGLRACDLAAIAVHDRVNARSGHPDVAYERARERAFIVAVACAESAATCFCVSMGTGPVPQDNYDLALTELVDAGSHRFVVHAGSERGAGLRDVIPHAAASTTDVDAATAVVVRAASQQQRRLDPQNARDVLAANLDHRQWDDVATRCLSCTNCTLVCPTCFCTSVVDVTDLTGEHAERVQQWSSCFTLDHSYVHGGSVRPDVRSRYRQWLTHKLSTWWDQFDESGCVGCGRCITWCPVGIDLTAEVAAIAATTEGER